MGSGTSSDRRYHSSKTLSEPTTNIYVLPFSKKAKRLNDSTTTIGRLKRASKHNNVHQK